MIIQSGMTAPNFEVEDMFGNPIITVYDHLSMKAIARFVDVNLRIISGKLLLL
jgi:hypothetical protein